LKGNGLLNDGVDGKAQLVAFLKSEFEGQGSGSDTVLEEILFSAGEANYDRLSKIGENITSFLNLVKELGLSDDLKAVFQTAYANPQDFKKKKSDADELDIDKTSGSIKALREKMVPILLYSNCGVDDADELLRDLIGNPSYTTIPLTVDFATLSTHGLVANNDQVKAQTRKAVAEAAIRSGSIFFKYNAATKATIDAITLITPPPAAGNNANDDDIVAIDFVDDKNAVDSYNILITEGFRAKLEDAELLEAGANGAVNKASAEFKEMMDKHSADINKQAAIITALRLSPADKVQSVFADLKDRKGFDELVFAIMKRENHANIFANLLQVIDKVKTEEFTYKDEKVNSLEFIINDREMLEGFINFLVGNYEAGKTNVGSLNDNTQCLADFIYGHKGWGSYQDSEDIDAPKLAKFKEEFSQGKAVALAEFLDSCAVDPNQTAVSRDYAAVFKSGAGKSHIQASSFSAGGFGDKKNDETKVLTDAINSTKTAEQDIDGGIYVALQKDELNSESIVGKKQDKIFRDFIVKDQQGRFFKIRERLDKGNQGDKGVKIIPIGFGLSQKGSAKKGGKTFAAASTKEGLAQLLQEVEEGKYTLYRRMDEEKSQSLDASKEFFNEEKKRNATRAGVEERSGLSRKIIYPKVKGDLQDLVTDFAKHHKVNAEPNPFSQDNYQHGKFFLVYGGDRWEYGAKINIERIFKDSGQNLKKIHHIFVDSDGDLGLEVFEKGKGSTVIDVKSVEREDRMAYIQVYLLRDYLGSLPKKERVDKITALKSHMIEGGNKGDAELLIQTLGTTPQHKVSDASVQHVRHMMLSFNIASLKARDEERVAAGVAVESCYNQDEINDIHIVDKATEDADNANTDKLIKFFKLAQDDGDIKNGLRSFIKLVARHITAIPSEEKLKSLVEGINSAVEKHKQNQAHGAPAPLAALALPADSEDAVKKEIVALFKKQGFSIPVTSSELGLLVTQGVEGFRQGGNDFAYPNLRQAIECAKIITQDVEIYHEQIAGVVSATDLPHITVDDSAELLEKSEVGYDSLRQTLQSAITAQAQAQAPAPAPAEGSEEWKKQQISVFADNQAKLDAYIEVCIRQFGCPEEYKNGKDQFKAELYAFAQLVVQCKSESQKENLWVALNMFESLYGSDQNPFAVVAEFLGVQYKKNEQGHNGGIEAVALIFGDDKDIIQYIKDQAQSASGKLWKGLTSDLKKPKHVKKEQKGAKSSLDSVQKKFKSILDAIESRNGRAYISRRFNVRDLARNNDLPDLDTEKDAINAFLKRHYIHSANKSNPTIIWSHPDIKDIFDKINGRISQYENKKEFDAYREDNLKLISVVMQKVQIADLEEGEKKSMLSAIGAYLSWFKAGDRDFVRKNKQKFVAIIKEKAALIESLGDQAADLEMLMKFYSEVYAFESKMGFNVSGDIHSKIEAIKTNSKLSANFISDTGPYTGLYVIEHMLNWKGGEPDLASIKAYLDSMAAQADTAGKKDSDKKAWEVNKYKFREILASLGQRLFADPGQLGPDKITQITEILAAIADMEVRLGSKSLVNSNAYQAFLEGVVKCCNRNGFSKESVKNLIKAIGASQYNKNIASLIDNLVPVIVESSVEIDLLDQYQSFDARRGKDEDGHVIDQDDNIVHIQKSLAMADAKVKFGLMVKKQRQFLVQKGYIRRDDQAALDELDKHLIKLRKQCIASAEALYDFYHGDKSLGKKFANGVISLQAKNVEEHYLLHKDKEASQANLELGKICGIQAVFDELNEINKLVVEHNKKKGQSLVGVPEPYDAIDPDIILSRYLWSYTQKLLGFKMTKSVQRDFFEHETGTKTVKSRTNKGAIFTNLGTGANGQAEYGLANVVRVPALDIKSGAESLSLRLGVAHDDSGNKDIRHIAAYDISDDERVIGAASTKYNPIDVFAMFLTNNVGLMDKDGVKRVMRFDSKPSSFKSLEDLGNRFNNFTIHFGGEDWKFTFDDQVRVTSSQDHEVKTMSFTFTNIRTGEKVITDCLGFNPPSYFLDNVAGSNGFDIYFAMFSAMSPYLQGNEGYECARYEYGCQGLLNRSLALASKARLYRELNSAAKEGIEESDKTFEGFKKFFDFKLLFPEVEGFRSAVSTSIASAPTKFSQLPNYRTAYSVSLMMTTLDAALEKELGEEEVKGLIDYMANKVCQQKSILRPELISERGKVRQLLQKRY
ncbi:MAG: hypothetical protein O3B09_01215, partial [Proteobacteria bacterium]|nr:hypothetical protein [Pseudomonadota bacterium]